jgi:hypothetical protein
MSEPTVKDYSEIYRLGQSDERERIVKALQKMLNYYKQNYNVVESSTIYAAILEVTREEKK